MAFTGAMLQVAAPSKPPGGRRVADAEVQRRLRLVEGLLAEGRSRAQMAASTGLSMRTLDSYTRRIRRQWEERAETDSQDARSRALGRLLALRERLLAERAWSPLVRVEQLLCELEGVRSGPVGPPSAEKTDHEMAAVAFSVDSLRERAPLLVSACVNWTRDSEDQALRDRLRQILVRGLDVLESDVPAKPETERAKDA